MIRLHSRISDTSKKDVKMIVLMCSWWEVDAVVIRFVLIAKVLELVQVVIRRYVNGDIGCVSGGVMMLVVVLVFNVKVYLL